MSNDLVANEVDQSLLEELIGSTENETNYPPILKVNYSAEDDETDADGNCIKLNLGWFVVTQNNNAVYIKEPKFRVFMQRIQYVRYNSKDEEFDCKTILSPDAFGEFPDTDGTLRCGKLTNKQLEENPSAKHGFDTETSKVTCNRILYGVLSGTGVDKYGEAIEVTELPVAYPMRGSNFMSYESAAKEFSGKSKAHYNFDLKLSTKREKNGSVVYYVVSMIPDFSNPVPFSNDNLDTLKYFRNLVDDENRYVMGQYSKKNSGEFVDGESEVADLLAIKDDTNMEDDEIPF